MPKQTARKMSKIKTAKIGTFSLVSRVTKASIIKLLMFATRAWYDLATKKISWRIIKKSLRYFQKTSNILNFTRCWSVEYSTAYKCELAHMISPNLSVMSCDQYLDIDRVSSHSDEYNPKRHITKTRPEGWFHKNLVCIVLVIGSELNAMK